MFDKCYLFLITDCRKALESLLAIQTVEIVTINKIEGQLAVPCRTSKTEQCRTAFHLIAKPIIDEICARINMLDLNHSEPAPVVVTTGIIPIARISWQTPLSVGIEGIVLS